MRVFLLLWMFVVSAVAAAAGEPLRVVTSAWPPYVGRALPNKGFAAELVATVFKRAGYRINLTLDTWPRALEGTVIGVFDVIGAVWHNEERSKHLTFSAPYLVNEVRFVQKKGQNIVFGDLGDLKGLMIGVVKDFDYDPAFNASKKLIKIQQNHAVQNLIGLKQGTLDLTVGDVRSLRYDMTQFMPGSVELFEFLDKPLARRGLRIAVSKSNPKGAKIIADFNQSLAVMKADGSYQAILRRHRF
ncbi:MAG: transporter substrate-binding domain-containing protein [Pseudomonadota bacterium]